MRLITRALATSLVTLVMHAHVSAAQELAGPDPVAILGSRVLRTPMVDPVPICIPSRTDSDLKERARRSARWPGTAREMADALLAGAWNEGSDAHLVRVLLEARAAVTPQQLATARDALAHWRSSRVGPDARVCARLETARLDLKRRRLPEAVAQARWASQLSGGVPNGESVRRTADLYAAEGFYLSGRIEAARALYRVLSANGGPQVAAAARLRFADVMFDSGNRKAAGLEYEKLLPRSREFGASIEGWGLRAVEAMVAAGDLEGAQEWLEKLLDSQATPLVQGVARIRMADILVARGDRASGLRMLRSLSSAYEPTRDTEDPESDVANEESSPKRLSPSDRVRADLAQFARLREIALEKPRSSEIAPEPGRKPRSSEIALEREREAAEREAVLASMVPGGSRAFADYARLLLAGDAVTAGRPAEALDSLMRVAFGPLSGPLAGSLRPELDRALAALADESMGEGGCADFVAAVGWRRRLLLRHVGSPEPLARLGFCTAYLGLEEQAIEILSEVKAQFGERGAQLVGLPLARASLSRGDLRAARRAAVAHVGDTGPHAEGWRLLHSEVEMLEGRYGQAAEVLSDLVANDQPRDDRGLAIDLLAQAALHLDRISELRHVLGDAILRLDPAERRRRAVEIGEAALMAADGHRIAGDLAAARRLYGVAREILPEGEPREQAGFWQQELGGPPAAPDGANRPTSGWSQLAKTQDRIDALRERLEQPVTGGPEK